MRTVATAGHVDHGKSSLVLALTGTDPDRFPEEKSRGLTIDLGFAFCTLPSGVDVGFVDVPGHVRFIKNMLAGVSAVDVALFVVAADEGWMRQSEEHRDILDLLGIEHGIIVLSKADLVDDSTLALVRADIGARFASSGLADAPIVAVDSRSGRGLDEVRDALDHVLTSAPAPRNVSRPRLWVDRVFTAKGAGTIVTGTLTGGSLARGESVLVGPRSLPARVRHVESHHEPLEVAHPGARVALNLAGIGHTEVTRGDAVVRAGQWTNSRVVDVALRPTSGELRVRGRLHAYVGSSEHLAWCRVLDGAAQFARLRFEQGVPVVPGDRLVLRDPGADRTVAGAEVLGTDPVARAADAPARLGLPLGPRLLAGDRWLPVASLPRLTGMQPAAALAMLHDAHGVTIGEWVVHRETIDATRQGVTASLLGAEGTALDLGIPLAELARAHRLAPEQLDAALADAPDLTVERGVVRHRSRAPSVTSSPSGRAALAALEAAPFRPPSIHERSLVRALIRDGTAVDVDGVLFATSALKQARQLIERALASREQLTVADARDILGSTRRYVVPLLQWLDAQGVTRRLGDVRVAGPRVTRP